MSFLCNTFNGENEPDKSTVVDSDVLWNSSNSSSSSLVQELRDFSRLTSSYKDFVSDQENPISSGCNPDTVTVLSRWAFSGRKGELFPNLRPSLLYMEHIETY
ncbi:hypothetical protein Anas_00353 [Armadillidium nasatum]|uniref:Uncharacterized protein n=1 Tax=Armadillidium nasatum TaxID=96803 RepID=A0A5N5TEE0_9CRUS|nr:hypothetical protein Anas_00353 [Armadillidium nasatum]